MEESPELKALTLWFYDVASTKDFDSLEHFVSREDGVLRIGTDPNEWWQGHAEIVRALVAQLSTLGDGAKIVGGEPHAYSEGPIGFAADRPTLVLPDGREVPFRFSAVYHMEAGHWTMVHGHSSIGVPNEQSLGRALPT